jgi:hypothetical protein
MGRKPLAAIVLVNKENPTSDAELIEFLDRICEIPNPKDYVYLEEIPKQV